MTIQTVRLNFQITEKAQERLDDYCQWSGRSASDVVRQLVTEYVDGLRPLRGSVLSLNGRRTNCTLPAPIVDRLDSKASDLGHDSTKGSVISMLLEDFLVWRHDGAVAFRLLAKLVRACDQKDRGEDAYLYHEALAEARNIIRIGE